MSRRYLEDFMVGQTFGSVHGKVAQRENASGGLIGIVRAFYS
jgi:hypothetical protein